MRQNRVWHDGVSLWEYTLAGNPGCISGHLNLGNHYKRTRQDEKALGHYREAMRLLPDHINSARSCAQCCRALNRSDEAIAYFQEAMRRAERKNPRYTAVHLEYAGYLRKLGRLEEARAAYEAVLAKDPAERTARAALERMDRK
jgi:cytochrome c-type biogenesis protein CcmH/NrfG